MLWCLKKGHTKIKCRNPAVCKKCNKRHPTPLHFEPREQEKPECTAKDITQVKSSYVHHGPTSPLMAILPVLMKSANSDRCIATYAFLDNGCGAVFVKDSLQRALHMQTKNTKLLIKTMNLEEMERAKVVQETFKLETLTEHPF